AAPFSRPVPRVDPRLARRRRRAGVRPRPRPGPGRAPDLGPVHRPRDRGGGRHLPGVRRGQQRHHHPRGDRRRPDAPNPQHRPRLRHRARSGCLRRRTRLRRVARRRRPDRAPGRPRRRIRLGGSDRPGRDPRRYHRRPALQPAADDRSDRRLRQPDPDGRGRAGRADHIRRAADLLRRRRRGRLHPLRLRQQPRLAGVPPVRDDLQRHDRPRRDASPPVRKPGPLGLAGDGHRDQELLRRHARGRMLLRRRQRPDLRRRQRPLLRRRCPDALDRLLAGARHQRQHDRLRGDDDALPGPRWRGWVLLVLRRRLGLLPVRRQLPGAAGRRRPLPRLRRLAGDRPALGRRGRLLPAARSRHHRPRRHPALPVRARRPRIGRQRRNRTRLQRRRPGPAGLQRRDAERLPGGPRRRQNPRATSRRPPGRLGRRIPVRGDAGSI
ncbi:MAG: hypothetical protein AVDCRST_MAG73-44, partial [uncultured Thermomicrobiales bacterium]